MDDTRDIAIRAELSSKQADAAAQAALAGAGRANSEAATAHARLNAINGQIKRLGDEQSEVRGEVAQLRVDFLTALYGGPGNEDEGIIPQLISIRAVHKAAVKVAAVVTSIAVSVSTGVIVYTFEFGHHNDVPAHHVGHSRQAAQQAAKKH